ncbi:M24 family metallopeptidase [Parasedimentitalea marina]|uniref:M24 family metallopeptidase n=1 Tax=Parasedimentitalea marina TaxID=2483033 RepID=A0A3T0N2Z6_9RHOB|nr:M24 family metallopeptidase [Parasedimentitalea marina]AZV78371.1 M24 family metallopeptidase [Parasedimentitalea marina]
MIPSNLPFGLDEYSARLTKVRAAMQQVGCDVLVVTDPANMAWLTGYDGWSFYVHQAVIIGPSGPPLWWGRAMDALGALRTVYMPSDAVFGYEDTFVQNPDKHPMEDLSRLLSAQGWANARIGLEMDNYYFTAAAYMSLVQELPSAIWVNANVLVNWQRAVKSPTEITYMRRAAKIVENMHATILNRAEPGMKKNELIADIYHAAIAGVDGHWGDYPSIVPLAPSGKDATAPHLTWDDNELQAGEATFFEIAGVYRRYHAPQSRTLFFGEPPAKYRTAEAAVMEAVAAGMEQAKPGNFAEDISNAFNATLNRLGFEKDSRCGYPIGLSYPPDWGEHTFSLRRDDRTVLEPGMTFHFMPALWLDDGGIEITEPVLITETSAEYLCTTPRGLMVKG